MPNENCPHCNGEGWYEGSGTKSGHHPDCDGNNCGGLCPVPVQVQIQVECECYSEDG